MQRMKRLYKYSTRAGKFYIALSRDGRFHPVYNDESLGSYESILQATDDLVCSATFSVLHPNSGAIIDTSELGIPDNPAEWERV